MRNREIQQLVQALADEGPPKHQRTLKRIIELRMGEHLGFKRIADVLNAEGYTGRLGAPWSFVTVRRAIDSIDLGTLSPNTCKCLLPKGAPIPELGDTWTGRWRGIELTGIVEEVVWKERLVTRAKGDPSTRKLDQPKILIRPFSWPAPSKPKKKPV